jgi:3-phenylpropionate/trans-cinnamate dioxygenase ferredoxin subunit
MINYKQLPSEQEDFVAVAAVDELPTGARLNIEIDGLPIIVFNIAGGLYAVGDVCSHDGNYLDDAPLADYQVICQRHGARFDVRDGKVLAPPAVVDIPAYPVRVVAGQIEVGIPKS